MTLPGPCRIIAELSKDVEMSRSWSSAHDWKSCKGQKPFESSNLSISAIKFEPLDNTRFSGGSCCLYTILFKILIALSSSRGQRCEYVFQVSSMSACPSRRGRPAEPAVSVSQLSGALTNPLHIGKVRPDGTRQFIGTYATVAVDVSSGSMTTVWRTPSKRAKKYGGTGR